MNGYVCFWKGKRIEIHADTTYKAQLEAEVLFKKGAGRSKVKRSDITVMLAEKGGEQVVHNATE